MQELHYFIYLSRSFLYYLSTAKTKFKAAYDNRKRNKTINTKAQIKANILRVDKTKMTAAKNSITATVKSAPITKTQNSDLANGSDTSLFALGHLSKQLSMQIGFLVSKWIYFDLLKGT